MSQARRMIGMDQVVHLARLLSSSLHDIDTQMSSQSSNEEEEGERRLSLTNDSTEVEEMFQASQDPYSSQSQSTFMMSQMSFDPSQSINGNDHSGGDGMDMDILNAPTRSARSAASLSSFEHLLKMPFRSEDDYLSVARVMRVLQIILQAQIDGVTRQIRGVYYDDVPLFESQITVSKIVHRLEDYFEVPSSHFRLTPAPKGLFAGPVAFSLRTQDALEKESESEMSDCTVEADHDGMYTWGIVWGRNEHSNRSNTFAYKEQLIQDCFQIEEVITKEEVAKVNWVIVIEKETFFMDRVQKMNRYIDDHHEELQRRGHGILITGKGMPDMSTRRWLELLADNLPARVPFYALMDGDAYGMHIYHTYQSPIKHYAGPVQQMAHRLQWIGLKPSDTLSVLRKRSPLGDKTAKECGAIPLELHERNRAVFLVNNEAVNEEIKDESLRLMMYGYKLELEAIASESLFSLMPDVGLNDG